MSEVWRNIPGYEGRYEVSELGEVRRSTEGKFRKHGILISKPNKKGDLLVCLYNNGYGIYRTVISLVAEAFIGPCPKGYKVGHIDADKTNNRPDNIEYIAITQTHKNGQKGNKQRGEDRYGHKLTNFDVEIIRELLSIGWNGSKIARLIGMSRSSVYAIRDRYTWSHLP